MNSEQAIIRALNIAMWRNRELIAERTRQGGLWLDDIPLLQSEIDDFLAALDGILQSS